MRYKISDQEFHALCCSLKNTKTALFLVAFFSWETFIGWKGLHKPPEHLDLFQLLFLILVVAMLAKWLVAFTCFRERLVFGLVIVSIAISEVEGFVPSVFGQYAEMVKPVELALWVLCLLVSLTMLVQAARTPKVEPNELQASTAQQVKQNLFIAFALVVAVLVLSPLIYLLPLRWVRWLARLVSF